MTVSGFTKVTVLMPVYNGERYLAEAVNSILAQTYKDFQLLIIDDGSTDATAEIVNSYKDSRIRLVCNDNNFGLVKTLNRGLELAAGEYVARMDADDIALPERIGRQVEYLEKNPDIAVLGSNLIRINPDGSTCDIQFSYPIGPKYLNWKIYWRCVLQHPTIMMRKEIIKEIGGYRQVPFAEDYDLWLRIVRTHRINNLHEVLIKYRVHPESISQKNKDTQLKETSSLICKYLGEIIEEEIDANLIQKKIAGEIAPGSSELDSIKGLMCRTLSVLKNCKRIDLLTQMRIKMEILFGFDVKLVFLNFYIKTVTHIIKSVKSLSI